MGSSFSAYSSETLREFSRATAEETLQQVISDLKDAYKYLPETAPMTGKMTKDAALRFLAKAYLLPCQ